MSSQTCRTCNIDKDISDFYFRRERNKYNTKCKTCVAVYKAKHAQENREKIVARTRTWRNLGRPDRRKAKRRLYKDLVRGKIQKTPCEICGSEKSESFHVDYADPLKINWLCRGHRMEREKSHREIANDEWKFI